MRRRNITKLAENLYSLTIGDPHDDCPLCKAGGHYDPADFAPTPEVGPPPGYPPAFLRAEARKMYPEIEGNPGAVRIIAAMGTMGANNKVIHSTFLVDHTGAIYFETEGKRSFVAHVDGPS
jgi:hypothetical protein